MTANEKIANAFATQGCTSYSVLVQIQGAFLIANNIQKEWAQVRGISPEMIDYEFQDHITLLQAQLLGVLDFMNPKKETTYSEPQEFLGTIEDDPKTEYQIKSNNEYEKNI